jgi:hypothetical protein
VALDAGAMFIALPMHRSRGRRVGIGLVLLWVSTSNSHRSGTDRASCGHFAERLAGDLARGDAPAVPRYRDPSTAAFFIVSQHFRRTAHTGSDFETSSRAKHQRRTTSTVPGFTAGQDDLDCAVWEGIGHTGNPPTVSDCPVTLGSATSAEIALELGHRRRA